MSEEIIATTCLSERAVDTVTLVLGFSVPMRYRIVTRWQKLEAQQQSALCAPETPGETLCLAADQQGTIEQQRLLIEQGPGPILTLKEKAAKSRHAQRCYSMRRTIEEGADHAVRGCSCFTRDH